MTAHLRRCWRRVALPCMEKPRSKATASVISRNNYPMVFLEQLLNLIDDFGKERKLFLNASIITWIINYAMVRQLVQLIKFVMRRIHFIPLVIVFRFRWQAALCQSNGFYLTIIVFLQCPAKQGKPFGTKCINP